MHLRLIDDLEELLSLPAWPFSLAVDMPLGLSYRPEPGGRLCDRLARAVLLPGRKASIFSAPSQQALAAYRDGGDYWAALRAQRGAYSGAPGLSLQAYHLLKNIAALDDFCRQPDREHLFESHPELAFDAAGGPHPPKRTAAGAVSRRRSLAALKMPIAAALETSKRPVRPFVRAAENDWLDACILAHVASRRSHGRALCLGADPPTGGALPQQIWY